MNMSMLSRLDPLARELYGVEVWVTVAAAANRYSGRNRKTRNRYIRFFIRFFLTEEVFEPVDHSLQDRDLDIDRFRRRNSCGSYRVGEPEGVSF